jgi:hypothetical protein
MAKGGTRTERLSATIRCINAHYKFCGPGAELASGVILFVLPVATFTGALNSIDRVQRRAPADL